MARALWRRPIIWWGARAGTAFGSTSVSKPVGERRLTCVVEHVLRTVRKVPPVTGPPGSGQRWRRRRRLPRHESPSAMTCDGCRACRRRCVWAGWAPPPRCAPHPVGDAVFVAPAAASVAREGWTATAAVVGVAAEGPRRRWWRWWRWRWPLRWRTPSAVAGVRPGWHPCSRLPGGASPKGAAPTVASAGARHHRATVFLTGGRPPRMASAPCRSSRVPVPPHRGGTSDGGR